MTKKYLFSSFLLIVFFGVNQRLYSQPILWESIGNNSISIIDDSYIYENNNHVAFTSLESNDGILYLAFREGASHVATNSSKGKIVVLKRIDNQWIHSHTFTIEGKDLRDPFLLKWNNRLLLYSMGYYSELTDSGWTPLERITHNAPHSLNIWKIREYKGLLYGIGNAHNKWPILLVSSDGINWLVKEVYKLGGNATEADLCFIRDSIYICFRVENPKGSLSLFGRGSYPFNNISWSIMSVSVASPELLVLPNKRILLAGREYDPISEDVLDGNYMALYTLNNKGVVLGRIRSKEDSKGDNGYSSFCMINGKYYMSYYTGNTFTSIKMLEFKLK